LLYKVGYQYTRIPVYQYTCKITVLPGAGVVVLLHHHGDQAILSSGSIKLQTGTDVEVSVVPQITVTSDDAVSKFDPEKRGCFTCDEVMATHALSVYQ
jgi:hypothetical protein